MTEIGAIALPPQQPPLIAAKTVQNAIQSVSDSATLTVSAPETQRSPEFSTVKSLTSVQSAKLLEPDAENIDRAAAAESIETKAITMPPNLVLPEFSATRTSLSASIPPRPELEIGAGLQRSASSNSRESSETTSSIEPVTDDMDQVTSVSQLSDVQPIDWAFQALQSLVERYGCSAGYPDRTFRGNRAVTRYEFAAGLNACLASFAPRSVRVQELIAAGRSNAVTQPDLDALQKLQAEFALELAAVKGRVDNLEARSTTLEKNQFSTTTRLFGQAILFTQASNQVDVDLFPRDGIPERQGELKPTFTNNVQLSLATSFSGRDLLLTTLQSGNLRSTAPSLFTNMGRLSYESELENQLFISDLSYRFPIANNFGVLIGAAGVDPSNTFRGINPLEGSGDGALSLLGQRNPILAIGNGTGGIGFDWQINRSLSLQGVYSAELPSFSGNANFGGLIGGRYVAGAQLTIAPTKTIDLGIHYLFSRSPDGFIGGGIGDSQLLSPFAPTNTAFTTHALGATLAWRLNQKLTIGGWGGWTSSKAIAVSGAVQTTNWMIFSAFPDLFVPGNLGGILFGQPPKITSSTLPEEYNFPRFSETGGKGGQPDTALHLEVFYRARINSFLDITPGVLVVFNSNHNAANDPVVVGALRATFRF